MPIIGLLIGHGLAHTLGSSAHIIGGALLIAAGAQTTYQALRANDDDDDSAHAIASAGSGRLLLLPAALSIDNLIVGFALGTYQRTSSSASPSSLGLASGAVAHRS